MKATRRRAPGGGVTILHTAIFSDVMHHNFNTLETTFEVESWRTHLKRVSPYFSKCDWSTCVVNQHGQLQPSCTPDDVQPGRGLQRDDSSLSSLDTDGIPLASA